MSDNVFIESTPVVEAGETFVFATDAKGKRFMRPEIAMLFGQRLIQAGYNLLEKRSSGQE